MILKLKGKKAKKDAKQPKAVSSQPALAMLAPSPAPPSPRPKSQKQS
jgi:hypothetical protein